MLKKNPQINARNQFLFFAIAITAQISADVTDVVKIIIFFN